MDSTPTYGSSADLPGCTHLRTNRVSLPPVDGRPPMIVPEYACALTGVPLAPQPDKEPVLHYGPDGRVVTHRHCTVERFQTCCKQQIDGKGDGSPGSPGAAVTQPVSSARALYEQSAQLRTRSMEMRRRVQLSRARAQRLVARSGQLVRTAIDIASLHRACTATGASPV